MQEWRIVVQQRAAVHTHPIDLVREESARRRDAAWIAVLYRHERRVFDSRTVSLELKSERGAHWLASTVRVAIEANVFVAPRTTSIHRAPLAWTHVGDDSACEHADVRASVQGARGVFHAGAHRPSEELFDSRAIAVDLEARSSDAARFLAELALDLTLAGHAIPPIA